MNKTNLLMVCVCLYWGSKGFTSQKLNEFSIEVE